MTTNSSGNVIPLPTALPDKEGDRKWTKPVMKLGYSMVPSLLFRAQQRLGLNATQLVVLLHLADYWWKAAQKPFPAKKRIAERMDLGERQVQRIIEGLEKANLVKRVARYAKGKGQQTNEYDLSGLVRRLGELAPEFAKVEEEVKAKRAAVARRGGIRRPSA